MTSEQAMQVAVQIAVPIVTAITGILALQFQDWRTKRSRDIASRQAMEEAQRRAEFASEWLKASALLDNSPACLDHAEDRAASWLEDAASLAVAAQSARVQDKSGVTIRRLL